MDSHHVELMVLSSYQFPNIFDAMNHIRPKQRSENDFALLTPATPSPGDGARSDFPFE